MQGILFLQHFIFPKQSVKGIKKPEKMVQLIPGRIKPEYLSYQIFPSGDNDCTCYGTNQEKIPRFLYPVFYGPWPYQGPCTQCKANKEHIGIVGHQL